jgi:RND family efflux transporter MFP subunit
MICILLLSTFLTAGLPGTSGAAPAPPSEPIVLRRCLLEYERSSILGSPGRGILQECLVRPGDQVEADQPLGRLQDKEARAELEMRQAQAENDTDLRLAQARHAQALAKLKSTELLSKRSVVSAFEVSTQRLEAGTAELAVEDARFRRRIAELEARKAQASVLSREIVAPHPGTVIAVHKRRGESVAYDEPLFHVVDPRLLRITGALDVGDIWRVRPGQPVRATLEIGGVAMEVESQAFPGRVVFIDRLVDPKSQTCKIVAEVDDIHGQLRAGLRARLEILSPGSRTTEPAPAR